MPPHSTLALTANFWRLAWPAILRNTLNCAADRMTLAFVGHYDPERAHYDGASLGKMYSNITGLSIGFGLCLGLATLCSQANGANEGKLVNGLHLRRCMVLLVFAFAYSSAAAVLCERLLLAFAQPADVALCSARYAQVQLIGVPFFWVTQALQTVCDGGLQDTRPGMYAGLISTAAQVGLCAVFVHPALCNWGYLGMAAARSAGGVVSLAVIIAIVVVQGRQAEVWRLPSRRQHGLLAAAGPPVMGSDGSLAPSLAPSLVPSPTSPRVCSSSGLCQFVCVAWPGALMMWLEWWCFEGLTVMVGTLPDATVLLAAHGTLFNILVVTYMCFTGLNSALCATVGKHIGAGTAGWAVPRLICVALGFAVAFAGAISATIYLLRDRIAHFFETDATVVAAQAKEAAHADGQRHMKDRIILRRPRHASQGKGAAAVCEMVFAAKTRLVFF